MLRALVINDRSDTSLSDYASRLNSVAMNHRRLSRCVSLTLHDRQTCFLSKSVNGRLVLVVDPRIVETSSHLDETIFPVFPTAGNSFKNPSKILGQPSFSFSPREKGFLIPGREFIGLG